MTHEQFAELADHLASRREAILLSWRQVTEADPQLTTATNLSRVQFNDHVPDVLDAFQHKLRAAQRDIQVEATEEERKSAAEHGTQRWQQGYDQREVMREWGHLQLCILDELERYEATRSDLAFAVMPAARRALAQLCSEGVIESVTRYSRLQQAEAAGRLRDLEQALAQLNELEVQRAALWHEAAHDLRGNLGVVTNAAAGLNKDAVPESTRTKFLTMLQKGAGSLHDLLTDLMNLARLEAGQERRSVSQFDAAKLLQDLCANHQSPARERGLRLDAEGPASLVVNGDSVKTIRIAQNLLLNALKYTERGAVRLIWGLEDEQKGDRWILCVQDTGPGVQVSQLGPLARELKHATDVAKEVADTGALETGRDSLDVAPTLASQSTHLPAKEPLGEGIGLSIVKRLCELLDASLELQTAAGEGTTFRVVFPVRYE